MCTEQRNRPCKPRLSGLFCVVQVQGFLGFYRKNLALFQGVSRYSLEKTQCIMPASCKTGSKSRFCRFPQLCCGNKSLPRLIQQTLYYIKRINGEMCANGLKFLWFLCIMTPYTTPHGFRRYGYEDKKLGFRGLSSKLLFGFR